jgi:hypothetical protein
MKNVSTKNAPNMSVVARAHRLHDRLWDLLLVLAERAHLTLWLTLHGEGPSLAQSRRLVGCDLSGTSLPRVTSSAGSHRSGAPTGPQLSWPTQRQATDILVLVSTDIPVRFPLTFSCGFTARSWQSLGPCGAGACRRPVRAGLPLLREVAQEGLHLLVLVVAEWPARTARSASGAERKSKSTARQSLRTSLPC